MRIEVMADFFSLWTARLTTQEQEQEVCYEVKHCGKTKDDNQHEVRKQQLWRRGAKLLVHEGIILLHQSIKRI